MKIVLGIDSPVAARVLLPLIGRLRLDNPCLDLVNVVDTTLPVTASSLMGAEPNGAFLEVLQHSGTQALEEAECGVRKLNYACKTVQEYGAPSRTLMEFATTSKADMIAVPTSGSARLIRLWRSQQSSCHWCHSICVDSQRRDQARGWSKSGVCHRSLALL